MKCSHNDCFTCPYPDCIADGKDLVEGRKKLSPQELVERRKATQKRWYEKHKKERKEYYHKRYLKKKAEALEEVEG